MRITTVSTKFGHLGRNLVQQSVALFSRSQCSISKLFSFLGTAIVGFTTAALVQCASKKRDAKRGALSKKSKRSVKSKKLSKSGKSAKSSKKSTKGSKKSARSLKVIRGYDFECFLLQKSARAQPLVSSTKKSKSSRREPVPKVAVKVANAQPVDGSAKSSKQSTVPARPVSDAARVQPPRRKSTRDSAQLPLAREKDEVQATQPASDRREADEQKGEGTDLHMQPEQLRFPTEGGLLHCVIHNPSADRQAVKVNFGYKVNPVYGFIEPNSTLRVDVCRVEGGKAKADKLIFVTAQAPRNEKEPKKLFNQKNRAEKEHMSVLSLLV
ncbi:Major sperm protein [Aphelenchoides besseyi]|nr:Major sperm protein [Aphelenchoides besseyi]